MTTPPELVDFARALALRSARVIRPLFASHGLRVDRKDDASLVTAADRDAEAAMRELIGARYPDHGVIGEEFGSERTGAEWVWVLDPIDGTISFVSGCPLFGTLIGLLRRGEPILGVIHQPVLEQLCVGTPDGTTLDGRPVRVRDDRALEEATLLTTDLVNIERHRDYAAFETLRRRVALFRTWGDCYGYLLLASGGADVMLDPVMHPWDLLPLIPIVRGAGGAISAWDGEEAVGADSCVAAAPQVHGRVLQILSGAAGKPRAP